MGTPSDTILELLPKNTWWRQVDGKEFIILEYNYDFEQRHIPIIGLKILEKYQEQIKIINREQALNLLKLKKWSKIS